MYNYENLKDSKFTHLPVAFRSINLGDDIQTECANRLWNVNEYVDRDDFSRWKQDMTIPFFGWYGYGDINTLPKASCKLVSFHFCLAMMKQIAKTPRFIDWCKYTVKHQEFPAIARDLATTEFMRSIGIECEFGGCLTQTLQPYTGTRDGIIGIDAPSEISEMCSTLYQQNNYELVHMSGSDRSKLAAKRIEVIKTANHVHTQRLHIFLPCKALNTPVTFYTRKVFEPHRLTGFT